jgi:hypothetical protein
LPAAGNMQQFEPIFLGMGHLDTFSSPKLLQQFCQKVGRQNGLGNFGRMALFRAAASNTTSPKPVIQ